MYIFNEKRKCCNHRCPDSVYLNTLCLITYLSAIKTLVCHRGMNSIGSTSFSFAQNTIHDFQNTELNSTVALSLTNATKIIFSIFKMSKFCTSRGQK